MIESYQNISDPALPEIPSEKLKIFRAENDKLNLPDYVSRQNLEWSSAGNDMFFHAIPDENEIAAVFQFPVEGMKEHLDFECYTMRLTRINFEHTINRVPRKTEGYVALRENVISVLLERTKKHLEEEYAKRSKAKPDVTQILTTIRAEIHKYTGTSIARLYFLIEALNEVMRLIRHLNSYGFDTYSEVLRRRAWKMIELKSNAFKSPGQVDDGSAPEQGIVRRAEDEKKWRELEAEEGAIGADVDWKRSYGSLGPYLTSRILIRRGLFDMLYSVIKTDNDIGVDDYPRILTDCIRMETRIGMSAGTDKKEALEKIISLLKEKIMNAG